MSTQQQQGLRAVGASSPLAQYRRMRLNASLQWAYAGATDQDSVGCLTRDIIDTVTPVEVAPFVNGQLVAQTMIANAAITAPATVYAAAAGKVSPTGTVLVGLAITSAAADGDGVVVVPSAAAVLGNIARASITAANATYRVPLGNLRAPGTMGLLGNSAGTPAGAFGITPGTFGTNSPLLVGEAANANSKTDAARFLWEVPIEYVAAGNITLRVRANITGNVQVAQTIGASAYKSDNGGGIGSNLIATAAQTVTASFVDYDFVITGATLNPGDVLDIQITGIANDTGGTANKLIQVGGVALIASVQG